MRIIECLRKAIRSAAVYNHEVQAPPACVLWPDKHRQWEEVIPQLQTEIPELFVLGEYDPQHRTGPAIWLRCVLARKIEDTGLFESSTPVFYLPGVSRQDLRAVESCPAELKPLAELQYRGAIWSQKNTNDWTILAFLRSELGGLGLDVAQDKDAISAMQLALYRLLDEDVELLRGNPLGKDFFNTLLTGGDPIRDLLEWLDRGEDFRSTRSENEWKGFVEVCKSSLSFNPEKDGVLTGGARLASHEGPWLAVWKRYCDAPKRYPHIPTLIRKCPVPKPPPLPLFTARNVLKGWPQVNDAEEEELRSGLLNLSNLTPHEARTKVIELEKEHHGRRALVWAELGESPLACALEYLAVLAEKTTAAFAAGTIDDLTAGYRNTGWVCDDALVRALTCAEKNVDLEAISVAIRTIYIPWAEESARHLQKIVEIGGYPGTSVVDQKGPHLSKGLCILFVDGLRYDTAHRLASLLSQRGYHVEEAVCWAALPTVTATGKPAVAPIREKITGKEADVDFEPCLAETGQSLKGGYHFRKQLEDAEWQLLEKSASGSPDGRAWCEFGNIDHEGHQRGARLVRHLDSMLNEIVDRIYQLFGAGWKNIRVVTDHGWLLVPGGLPKVELPSALVDHKWGRCALIKPDASTNERLYPWHWNPAKSVALADGISCYRDGEEYAHGGLSLQECLTLELTITKGATAQHGTSVEITDVSWKGMRCTVAVDGDFSELDLDIRLEPANKKSSAVLSVKPLKTNGTASVVVEDEDLEGKHATVVLVDKQDGLVAQVETVIGGQSK